MLLMLAVLSKQIGTIHSQKEDTQGYLWSHRGLYIYIYRPTQGIPRVGLFMIPNLQS